MSEIACVDPASPAGLSDGHQPQPMRAGRPSAARHQAPGGCRPEKKLSPLFDELYAEEGRSSIPPEQRLKARVLTALYSVRSERLFCEQLGYNLLWLWFLDREFHEGSFDHSVLCQELRAGGGNLWLGQDGGRVQTEPIRGLERTQAWGYFVKGTCNHAAHGAARGGLKRR